MDRNKLEAPLFEATFQSLRAELAERGTLFVSPPHQRFTYVEEPNGTMYNRASGYAPRPPRLTRIETVTSTISRYGVTWRGLRVPHDRENGIAGTEIVVVDLETKTVMAVLREFGLTGHTKGTHDGTWWLTAGRCPEFHRLYRRPEYQELYGFIGKVLRPKTDD